MPIAAERVLTGDVRAAARMIRDVEDGVPSVLESLKALYPATGRAHIIGITGSPGVGKSTLVDEMISQYRKRAKTVGVLAVDPTSPLTGGALLGDRLRMQRHSLDEGVFIRSIANRGCLGGLAQSVRKAIDVLDAMGKDIVIVETVGVGQGEVDVVKNVHTTVVVGSPGMGDDIQAIKAGILEVGDVFVINKADREGADKAVGSLRMMIDVSRRGHEAEKWKPRILKTQATSGEGVPELLEEINRHAQYLFASQGSFDLRKQESKVREELKEMLKNHILQYVFEPMVKSERFEEAIEEIVSGKTDPYTVSDRMLSSALRANKDRD